MNRDDHTQPSSPDGSGARKIRHTPGSPGSFQPSAPYAPSGPREPDPVPVARPLGSGIGSSKITTFGKERRHEEKWSRTPNVTGAGAIHVKTFNCKLTEDALAYMDQSINEWLDAHPQYEVKFVTSSVGVLTGKLKEPHLICQVWV